MRSHISLTTWLIMSRCRRPCLANNISADGFLHPAGMWPKHTQRKIEAGGSRLHGSLSAFSQTSVILLRERRRLTKARCEIVSFNLWTGLKQTSHTQNNITTCLLLTIIHGHHNACVRHLLMVPNLPRF